MALNPIVTTAVCTVQATYTFRVDRDILQDPGSELPLPTDLEMTMAVWRSRKARAAAVKRYLAPSQQYSDYRASMDCVMCGLTQEVTLQNTPEYFPPFEIADNPTIGK